MNALTASILSTVFVLLGTVATVLMLQAKGNPQGHSPRLSLAHRAMGYAFTAIFLVMLVAMVRKVIPYQGQWSPRAVFHTGLALGAFLLLLVKIHVVRYGRALTAHLFWLGVSVFVLSSVMVILTAGYYFIHTGHVKYVAVTDADEDILDESWGQWAVRAKCGKCHTLERAFRAFKSREGWTRTVNRMAVIDTPNISPFDVKQIIHFLTLQQERREKAESEKASMLVGKTLVERKCSQCHELDRVYAAQKNEAQWKATIERMAGYSGDPEFLKAEEPEAVISHLAGRQ